VRKTILCLANSYKHGGRCVAGVCLDDGTWIRLRGAATDGSLQPLEYSLDDCSEPRLLDVIEVELHYALPSDAHPEDWQIAPVRWRLLQRPATASQLQKIAAAADIAPTILRDYCDRMPVEEIQTKPLQSSLVLVCPSEIHWWIREERGKRKFRALFRRHNVTYDLAVTDPRWLERLNLMPAGIYPHATFAEPDCDTWLTVSLSEAFHGWHYKLVAGVIVRTH
jgi:hypothetical protein